MKTLPALALGLALAFGAPLAAAAPIILVADVGGPLNTVDAATGAVTAVGNTGVIMADIAFNPAGQLYGISESILYRIDTTSAVTIASPILVGDMGIYPTSLVFGADGTLYTAVNDLYTINPATAQATLVGSGGYHYGGDYGYTGDLAFIGEQLLVTTQFNDFTGGFVYEDLVHLDTSNGHGTLVGHIGSRSIDTGDISGFLTVWGLATPDNVALYGVAGRQVISIDPATAAATLLVNDYGQPPFQTLGGANGAAIGTEAANAVPVVPAAWLLPALLAPVLARCRRRRAA